MDQHTYVPYEQPIEGLQNTTEMMDNKYNLKTLMENSTIQKSTPEFVKMIDRNLIIDDDDMIFENFQENDTNDITDEEQNIILSAFESALTGAQPNQLGTAINQPNRNQISLPNIKIVKSKMYEIEEPFFKDFDDILPPQPPSYDDHIETVRGSLHRPILPIDTLFPTDDIMYQNGSLVMQNGEKYILTNYAQKLSNEDQKLNIINSDSKAQQTIPPLLSNFEISQNTTPQNNTPITVLPQSLSDNQLSINPQQSLNDSAASINSSQGESPYMNILDPEEISPYMDINQQGSQLKMNNFESGKPLFDFNPPFTPPPFMPPPQSDQPSYRNIAAQPYRAPSKKQQEPSYRPIQAPKYPEFGLLPEEPAKIPQKPIQQHLQHDQPQPQQPQQQQQQNEASSNTENSNSENKKKNSNRRAEAMPC